MNRLPFRMSHLLMMRSPARCGYTRTAPNRLFAVDMAPLADSSLHRLQSKTLTSHRTSPPDDTLMTMYSFPAVLVFFGDTQTRFIFWTIR